MTCERWRDRGRDEEGDGEGAARFVCEMLGVMYEAVLAEWAAFAQKLQCKFC